MSFQYFVYISDAKVDMLVQQIEPGRLNKRSSEAGIDLKLVKAKRVVDTTAGAERVGRLQRVIRHLADFGDLGDVDAPGQFFGGMLPLRWGPMVGRDGYPLAYFGGHTGTTVVGLGGSRTHLVGGSHLPEQDSPSGRSHLPALLQGLTPPFTGDDEAALVAVAREDDEAALRRDEEEALTVVHRATTSLRGPAQNMEFVAKRLLHGPGPEGRPVLLGTPLYVALVD